MNRAAHPSYTGLLLWSVGLALFNPSLPGLAILFATTLPQMVYRIHVEERMMEERFGDAWGTYRRSTRMLLPFVW